jgi:activator of 2-hydroxyglutaryl-CoA dehydratase
MKSNYFAGVDIGSTMTKVVILGDGKEYSFIGPTGPEHRKLANRVMEEALGRAGISFGDVTFVVATGYGRINVPFADRRYGDHLSREGSVEPPPLGAYRGGHRRPGQQRDSR